MLTVAAAHTLRLREESGADDITIGEGIDVLARASGRKDRCGPHRDRDAG